MKILIIDDNFKLRENIREYFREYSILCEEAYDGQNALEKVGGGNYDVIILDVNMPHINGREFLEKIRAAGSEVPVLALTSNTLIQDKLEMFRLGVDDYVTKPFNLDELLARVKALYRRHRDHIGQTIEIGDTIVDLDRCRVTRGDEEINLPNKEYRIVEYLAINRGNPRTKTDILEHVWGEQQENLNLDTMTFEVHISSIRKKLGKDFIMTIRGIGYVIE